ncbi:N-acetyltransferase [Streptomyces sp. NPDC093111]|uniref:GNAT family N-acetyltransferase n=1 Tax=Streptomyces sp. NPDC093111 TaxID=3154978 RepID=UPI003444D300
MNDPGARAVLSASEHDPIVPPAPHRTVVRRPPRALDNDVLIGDVVVRRLGDGDSVEQLTTLLHRSYADHAEAGRVFFASYQSVQDTAHRVAGGECWLALRGPELVGSVTVAAETRVPEECPAPVGAGFFWQLAVDPALRGRGLGRQLMALAEKRIAALGAPQVVIDTSVEAVELVAWYRRRGYAPVGSWRWGVTNYESVGS